MIAHVILGKNIDTLYWIMELKSNLYENIIVIDYDHYVDPLIIDEVTYLSDSDARKQLNKFDSVNFYKSMYVYPGTYSL